MRHENGASHWWIRLRCGQYGVVRDIETVSNEEAARFERELDPGVTDVAATVAHIEREGADAPTAALRHP